MKVVIQRVSRACVRVENEVVGQIQKGLCVLGRCALIEFRKSKIIAFTVGVHKTDSDFDAKWIAKKLLAVRLFESDDGKTWNKSAKDHGYGILAVSQFTLYAFLKVCRTVIMILMKILGKQTRFPSCNGRR